MEEKTTRKEIHEGGKGPSTEKRLPFSIPSLFPTAASLLLLHSPHCSSPLRSPNPKLTNQTSAPHGVDGPEVHPVLPASPPLGLGRRRRSGLLRRGGWEAREGEAGQGGGGKRRRRRRRRERDVPGGGLRSRAPRRQGLPPEAPRL
jgi:hypothetical protein